MKTVDEQDSEEEVYHTSALTSEPDDAQLVTLKFESGNYLRFRLTPRSSVYGDSH